MMKCVAFCLLVVLALVSARPQDDPAASTKPQDVPAASTRPQDVPAVPNKPQDDPAASTKPQDDAIASRGCRYIMGRCVEVCPEGTHAYTTGCSHFTPEATCETPNPVKDTRGFLCDYSSCYCDEPTVRDTKTDKCVTVDQCS